MVFSSNVFLTVFFPVLLICYHLPVVQKRNWKNAVLLFFSVIFYMWGEPVFIFVLFGEILINWVFTLQLDKREKKSRKIIMAFLVCFDVLILFMFKYLMFVINNIFSLIHVDKPVMEIALPIGISFFSFQMISYVVDVYRKEVPASKSLSKLMLYVMMFPQLIAGPIVRYKTIQHGIDKRIESAGEWREGFIRFSYGLGKKVLISNYTGMVVDSIFQTVSAQPLSVLSAVYGSLMYTFQIYFDFSGYSDMAIGLGKMFGFHFPENFNYPYMSGTITEFWRRWHMTLSSWFRDYVYIPGGGNRCSREKQIRNMFVVWVLTGIWHGANWTFLAWGLLYFILLFFEKYVFDVKRLKIFSHLYTLFWVNLAWVIFRADSLKEAVRYIGYMFGVNANGIYDRLAGGYVLSSYGIFMIAVVCSTKIPLKMMERLNAKTRMIFENLTSVVLVIVCVLMAAAGQYNPFIYFNF